MEATSQDRPDGPSAPRGRDEVVEALLGAATQLFAERGIGGTSVRDVASAAGVNHALVFRHFGSKKRLVRTVLDRQLDDLLAEVRRAGLGAEALAALGDAVNAREDLWKLLTRAVLEGEVDFVAEREFPEMDEAIRAVERAAEAGLIGADVPPRTLLLIVLAGALGWVLGDRAWTVSVGAPGATGSRRRELVRASFMELLGFAPEGSVRLTDEEARQARVEPEPPPRLRAPRRVPPAPEAPSEGPPRGRDQVVHALTEAAMDLFAERGPASVSVREVAARAGVNHALVFRHFGSKEGLTQAVWEQLADDLAGRMLAAPDFAGVAALTETLAESERTWKLAARALLDGDAETFAAVRYHFVDGMVWAADVGQRSGLLESRIHPRLLVAMVMATGLGMLVFQPVLRPLLGLEKSDPVAERDEVRAAAARLMGWKGPMPAVAGRA